MLSTLQTLIDERNTKDQATQLKKFADIYYSGAPVDEAVSYTHLTLPTIYSV